MANSQKMHSDNRKLIRSFSEKKHFKLRNGACVSCLFYEEDPSFHALEIIRKAK